MLRLKNEKCKLQIAPEGWSQFSIFNLHFSIFNAYNTNKIYHHGHKPTSLNPCSTFVSLSDYVFHEQNALLHGTEGAQQFSF
jgi:hypothetical protein